MALPETVRPMATQLRSVSRVPLSKSILLGGGGGRKEEEDTFAPLPAFVELLTNCLTSNETLEQNMAKQHSPGFLAIASDAKTRVRECAVQAVKARLDAGQSLNLIDVREESEFAKGHLPGAVHLSKGVIERDVEAKFPDLGTELVLYCGGGFRSAMAADNLQKMGYRNVISMDGGWSGWKEAGYPVEG